MKAIIAKPDAKPCLVYWTGRVWAHVGVVTYCNREVDAKEGVLQVPDDVPACEDCESAVKEHRYPKHRHG